MRHILPTDRFVSRSVVVFEERDDLELPPVVFQTMVVRESLLVSHVDAMRDVELLSRVRQNFGALHAFNIAPDAMSVLPRQDSLAEAVRLSRGLLDPYSIT